MADDVQLSQEQLEKLLQFQDLTGLEDMDQCRRVLEMHNWDLEVAVQDTLNMQDHSPPPPPPPLPQTRNHTPMPLNRPNYFYHGVFSRDSVQNSGFVGWAYFLALFPFRFLYATLFSLVDLAVRILRPDTRRAITDPVTDVVSFISSYESQYGTRHPVFYRGSYSQVVNDAKRELKFLLVYLHGDNHQHTTEFCEKTLGNEEVISFVNTNMLFWACSVSSTEGYKASQILRENTYPFLAVIVLKDNRMSVIARIEGMVGPAELVRRIQRSMEDNERFLAAARAERNERTLTQTIRRQQDEAYQESLRQDQEKEKKRREELELLAQAEQERRDKEANVQRRIDEIRRMKIELSDQVPDEPAVDHPDTIRIVIKLPQGTRLERRFIRSQSLKYLYYFVFCHPESPDEFQIITNFPRTVLPCQPTSDNPEPLSFSEYGLGRSELFFVHNLAA